MTWTAPPFPAADPYHVYPLSSFPPSSFWERRVIVPALIVPARRTAELRNRLKHVLRHAAAGTAKSKHNTPVQPLNEDDDDDDDDENIIRAAMTIPPDQTIRRSDFRKLVLRTTPIPILSKAAGGRGAVATRQQQHQTTPSNDHNDAENMETVFQDEIIQSLLSEAEDGMRCYKARHVLIRTYPNDYTVDEIFKILLPQATELPGSSFEVVGTIAHFNLRDEFLPFKYWIGKVLYDKHQPRIETVVTKIGTIDTVYRTFDMEIIAPCVDKDHEDDQKDVASNRCSSTTTIPKPLRKDWSVVNVNEEGCTFRLDYQKVYWNSRLSSEHQRLVKLLLQENLQRQQDGIKEPLVVADLMAGVGPFAVPLTTTTICNSHNPKKSSGKKGSASSLRPNIIVHANDLNPSCYHYLQLNARQNKCHLDQLHFYNMDGRSLVQQLQDAHVHVDHFIMNLPAMAPECCTAFQGYHSCHPKQIRPIIHVYCFAPKPSPTTTSTSNTTTSTTEHIANKTTKPYEQQLPHPYQVAVDRCSQALQCELDWVRDEVTVHVVRDVSPNKNMVCVSFRLPTAVQDLPRVVNVVAEQGEVKLEQQQLSSPVDDKVISKAQDANETIPASDTDTSPDPKRLKLMQTQQAI